MKCRVFDDYKITNTGVSDHCFSKCFSGQKLGEDILKETDWRGKPVLGEKAQSHDSDMWAGEDF